MPEGRTSRQVLPSLGHELTLALLEQSGFCLHVVRVFHFSLSFARFCSLNSLWVNSS